jgi:hypothetical protein
MSIACLATIHRFSRDVTLLHYIVASYPPASITLDPVDLALLPPRTDNISSHPEPLQRFRQVQALDLLPSFLEPNSIFEQGNQ